MVEADVCIVGAGIMGSAAAYYLSKNRKLKIRLIDQYAVGNDYSSSSDVNRVFRYAYGKDEFYTKLAIESRKLWDEIERETGTSLLIPSGLLLIQGSDEEWNRFNEETYRTFHRLGLKTEELAKEDIAERFPQFTAERAFLDPYGAVTLASKALTTLASSAIKNGVMLLKDTRVTRISIGSAGEPSIELANGRRISSDKVILTVGPWSNDLLPDNLVRMTPTRQQILYFQPSSLDSYRPNRFPIFFADNFYGIPAAGIDAVKVSHIGRDTPVRPETAKRTIDAREVDASRDILHRFIPGLSDGKLIGSKVCLYDMTGDKDFVVGSHPSNNEVIYGYGFSGHGFKFAPLIGRTLARIAVGQDAGFDIHRFDPCRTV